MSYTQAETQWRGLATRLVFDVIWNLAEGKKNSRKQRAMSGGPWLTREEWELKEDQKYARQLREQLEQAMTKSEEELLEREDQEVLLHLLHQVRF